MTEDIFDMSNFSDMSGLVSPLFWTSTKQWFKCLAQGYSDSAGGEALISNHSIPSLTLTALRPDISYLFI